MLARLCGCNPTARAYLVTRILDAPFWALFNLIPFILYKDLELTPWLLASVITLKPLLSIFSSYWAHWVGEEVLLLKRRLMLGRVLAFLPFFLLPVFPHPFLLISAFATFLFFQVGMAPVWMECLKEHSQEKERHRLVSFAQVFGYLGGGVLPLGFGWMLDVWPGSWRVLFPLLGVLALGSLFVQRQLQTPRSTAHQTLSLQQQVAQGAPWTHPWTRLWLGPWSAAWQLLRARPDFARFQLGAMLIGSGLMCMQPALPMFFLDRLHLSYTELGAAIALCKGAGFATGSPAWVRALQRIDLFAVSAIIALLALVFPLLLVTAQSSVLFLYVGYFLYGVMQAGNELSWNVSGPLFAQGSRSVPFSVVNVLAVGIRGACIPLLGAYVLNGFGISGVMTLSALLCLTAACWMGFTALSQGAVLERARLSRVDGD